MLESSELCDCNYSLKGDYILQNEQTIRLRKNLWMVSTGNIFDNPNPPSDLIVNEEQVIDEAGLFEYVEIHCREQTGIYIKANEADGDDFNVALFPSAYVKKARFIGNVTHFDPDPDNAL